MTQKSLMIIGAGRHAVETYYLLDDLGLSANVSAFLQEHLGEKRSCMDLPILSRAEVTSKFDGKEKPLLLGAIGAIQDNKRMVDAFVNAGFEFFNAVPPSVNLHRQKFIGTGITIAQGTVLTTNISIDNYSMINIGCTLSHDVEIGKFVNISPGVHLAGYVKIGDEVFIGTGATVIPRVSVGEGSYVAAGACVTKDVPPHSMVAGVPAVVKKDLPS